MFQGDDDSVGVEIEVNVDDFPFVAERKKSSVVLVEIFHPNKIQTQCVSSDSGTKFPEDPKK
ncbi:hypothetical protein CA85_08110 [Allorhodopirellula solitaria]|uniref:Uncharacterized protein n=1 Tax=Allorhodopirellula solitaria TaxID=2527987 RepID=A0A5C5YG48_9BACT|nr:hypothetical protein CA85_08110 [Allorhodopirellula solitaria]